MTRCAPSPVAACSAATARTTSPSTAIGFGLFDMPALAAVARQIVAEEQAIRRPVTVVIADAVEPTDDRAVVTDPVAGGTREPA